MTDGRAPTLAARQPRAVHSALAVLEAVAQLGAGATAREISRELELPRATAYRLLNLLVQDEYLVRTPDLSGFALGTKVAQLAAVAVPPARLSWAARAVVADARGSVRGGVHVALYVQGRTLLIDPDPDFPFSDGIRLAREPERYALGRLLLVETSAGLPEAQEAASDYARFGATRQRGEITAGYGCLALPLRDPSGVLVGALGFSGPRHRVDDPEELLRALTPVAERLSPLVA